MMPASPLKRVAQFSKRKLAYAFACGRENGIGHCWRQQAFSKFLQYCSFRPLAARQRFALTVTRHTASLMIVITIVNNKWGCL
jgi:hypothetical protein